MLEFILYMITILIGAIAIRIIFIPSFALKLLSTKVYYKLRIEHYLQVCFEQELIIKFNNKHSIYCREYRMDKKVFSAEQLLEIKDSLLIRIDNLLSQFSECDNMTLDKYMYFYYINHPQYIVENNTFAPKYVMVERLIESLDSIITIATNNLLDSKYNNHTLEVKLNGD